MPVGPGRGPYVGYENPQKELMLATIPVDDSRLHGGGDTAPCMTFTDAVDFDEQREDLASSSSVGW